MGSLSLESRSPRQGGGLTRFWYVPVGFLVAAAVAYGIVWGVDRFGSDDGDQPAAPAAATATATATAAPATPAATPTTPAATPEPTPTPPPTEAPPVGRFSPGQVVVVAGTGSCLNIRAVASIEGEILTCLADGTNLTVIEGPVEEGNLTWWLIAGPEVNGWAADLYLSSR